MFDIGWSEMALILLVALIVIGPKDLPRVARNVGQWVGKGRAMAREFQRALEDMAREAELDKVKSEIEKAGRTDIGKTIEKSIDPSGELSKAFDPNAGTRPASGARLTQGDRPEGETKPAPAPGAPVAAATPAPGAPVAAATPAPASNGGSVPEARKQAAPEVPPIAPEAPPAAPAKRKRRARAGNGAAVAEDATEPARTTAPAEPG